LHRAELLIADEQRIAARDVLEVASTDFERMRMHSHAESAARLFKQASSAA